MNLSLDQIFACLKLSKLSDNIMNNIKILCVPKNFIYLLYFVTYNDMFYVFNKNKGYAQKVNKLCKKEICEISFSDKYSFAICKTGDAYFWHNSDHLDNQHKIINFENLHLAAPEKRRPELIKLPTYNKYIIDVTCANDKIYVLMSCGEVYVNYSLKYKYEKVAGLPAKVISISCTSEALFALTANGEIFFIDNEIRIHQELTSLDIQKMVSSLTHTMFLSSDGKVYYINPYKLECFQSEGYNETYKLYKVDHSEKFKDIFASNTKLFEGLSILLSEDNKFYIWDIKYLIKPTELAFNSIYEIYAIFSPIITWKCIKFSDNEVVKNGKETIGQSMAKLFNNPLLSDVKFKFDNKFIYAHKLILYNRSEHFQRMFSGNWKENTLETIEMTQYSYEVFYAFMKYLYSDTLEINLENSMQLCDLANYYFEDELKSECLKIIKNGINTENVLAFYEIAINQSFEEIEIFCLDYGTNHFHDIINSKEFKDLNKKTCKKFVESLI